MALFTDLNYCNIHWEITLKQIETTMALKINIRTLLKENGKLLTDLTFTATRGSNGPKSF